MSKGLRCPKCRQRTTTHKWGDPLEHEGWYEVIATCFFCDNTWVCAQATKKGLMAYGSTLDHAVRNMKAVPVDMLRDMGMTVSD